MSHVVHKPIKLFQHIKKSRVEIFKALRIIQQMNLQRNRTKYKLIKLRHFRYSWEPGQVR